MAWVLPTFILPCKIWRGPLNIFTDPPSVETMCNLTPGKRVSLGGAGDANLNATMWQMIILLPKLTDVRGVQETNGFPDHVLVPSGTTRFYTVRFVDDIAKGFDNEHRFAVLDQYNTTGTWTLPMQ